jgi:thioredoxin 1
MKQQFGRIFILSNLVLALFIVVPSSCKDSASINKAGFHSKEGVQFYDSSLQAVAALAKSTNKPVFIMVHANWCAVCKEMKIKVLPQKDLGDFYNAHFINAAVDFDSEDGKMLRNQYGVSGTPAFIYLTPDGQLINKTSGFQEKEDLIAAARNLKVDGKAVCN